MAGILGLLGKGALRFGKKVLGKANVITSFVDEIPTQSEYSAGKTFGSPAATEFFSGSAQGLKNLGSFVKKELVVNPIARLKAKAGGIGISLGVLGLGRYAATGNLKLPSGREVAAVSGFAINPIAASIGLAEGGFTKVRNVTSSAYDKAKNEFYSLTKPDVPAIPTIPADVLNMINGYRTPNTSTVIDFSPASTPVNVTLPSSSFSPYTQVGGGGIGEMLPLLLLLGGGAALGGYALGKHKRKKRKSKKRKHSK